MKFKRLFKHAQHSLQHYFLTRIAFKKSQKFKFSKILNSRYSPPPKNFTQETVSLQILKVDIQVLETDLNHQYKLLGKLFYKELITKKKSNFSSPKIKTIQNKIKTLVKNIEKKKQQLLVIEKTLNSNYKSTELEKKSRKTTFKKQ